MRKSELEKIRKFHGHIGPYAVTGYIIGQLVKSHFGKIEKIVIYNPLKTPYSCLIDGLQLSSGCTVGCSSIILKKAGDLKIIIYLSNKKIVINLNQGFKKIAQAHFKKDMKKFARLIKPLINNNLKNI
ncbi:MAG: FmdE family protein [Patescibacteria group bacterium]|nr:FmdE family protein [Patescibacteria group bacterium]